MASAPPAASPAPGVRSTTDSRWHVGAVAPVPKARRAPAAAHDDDPSADLQAVAGRDDRHSGTSSEENPA